MNVDRFRAIFALPRKGGQVPAELMSRHGAKGFL